MDWIIKITAFCVTGALLAVVLRRGSPETALLLVIAAATVVLLALMTAAGELTDFLRELTDASGVPRDLFKPLYKTVGIAMVVKLGGGLCRDAQEAALAAVVETAGAICALLAALPLLRSVLSLLLELMGT